MTVFTDTNIPDTEETDENAVSSLAYARIKLFLRKNS